MDIRNFFKPKARPRASNTTGVVTSNVAAAPKRAKVLDLPQRNGGAAAAIAEGKSTSAKPTDGSRSSRTDGGSASAPLRRFFATAVAPEQAQQSGKAEGGRRGPSRCGDCDASVMAAGGAKSHVPAEKRPRHSGPASPPAEPTGAVNAVPHSVDAPAPMEEEDAGASASADAASETHAGEASSPIAVSGGEEDAGDQASGDETADDEGATTAVPTVDGREDGLSEYERMRLENIRRNEAMLASLGLDVPTRLVPPPKKQRPKPARKKRPNPPRVPQGPVRSSSRLRGRPAQNFKETGAEGEDEPEEEATDEIAEVDYDDSSVLRYTCSDDFVGGGGAAAAAGAVGSLGAGGDGGRVVGFGLLHNQLHTLRDEALSRIYAMHVRGGLLAAAGHGGRLAICERAVSILESVNID
jgi:hypothetical protein